MKTINLFGENVEYPSPVKSISNYQKFKGWNNYRKSDNPKMICGTCKHFTARVFDRTYFKCRLIGLSRSTVTDIAKGHVCNKWELA